MAKNSKTNNIYINGKQAGNTLADLKKKSRKLNNEINQMKPGTDAYKRKVQELGGVKKVLKGHRDEIKKLSGSYKKVKSSMGGIKNLVGGFLGAGAIMEAVRGIVTVATDWIKTNAKLEASLSSLQALTGASATDLKFYKQEAIEMGARTTQSANQVLDAMKLIGSAKPELLANKEALADVTDKTITLAEAAQIEMKPAADALTSALNQYSLGAEHASRFTNVLAAGSKAGASNIADLGQSIDKSGAVMAGYNVSIEEGVGLLETLGEKNLKGAEAGTKLRNVLLTMQSVDALPRKAIEQLDKFGVNTEIVADKTLPLNQRLEEMAKISGDATALMRVFGKENIVAGSAILNNTEKVGEFTEAVTGTNTALEQQKINNDNLQGDLKSLSSAWEGMMLTIGGAGGALRKLVQTGTKALNWVRDITNAFRDWDVTKMRASLLKLLNTWIELSLVFYKLIPGLGAVIDYFQDMIAEQIRMDELTSAVTDGMKEEQRSLSLLTASLADNNKALKEGNLTEEESIAVKEENQKIIENLNEKFPELTKNIDLQSASNEELIKWQEQASESILQSAIAEVKAAEQKKILNDIVEETIALRKQEAKEAKRWAATNWFADIFADDAADMKENIDKSKENLQNLGDDFKEVENTVKDLDLNFVIDFETADEAIDNQMKRITALRAKIKKAKKEGNSADVKGLEAQLEADITILQAAKDKKQEIKDEELEEIADAEEEAAEDKREAADKAAKEVAKAQRKQLEKLQGELEKLSESEAEINQDKNREVALANKEGFEKELQEKKFSIEDKYKEEIESAKKLAKEKGEIGKKGADKLAMFEALKQEELVALKEEILKKHREKYIKDEEEAVKERAEAQIRIEDAIWNTKRTILQMRLDETADYEIEKRRQINEQINQLDRDQQVLEFERKKEQVDLKLENEEIDKQEHDIMIEELEAEHQQKLTEIDEKGTTDRKKLQQEQVQNAITATQMAVDVISELQKAQHQTALNRIDKEADTRIEQLDKALNKNEINQRQYDTKVAAIETQADERKKAAMLENFKRQKTLSLIQVAIDTASAIMTGIATFGPPPSPLGIAAIAAAGSIGISQAALIAGQEPPQFAEGGFTTVTGAEDGKSYNAKVNGETKAGMMGGGPQLVLANEQGPEYFIPNPMLGDPQVIDHVRAIENIRVNQFAEGGATEQLPENTQEVVENKSGMSNQVLNSLVQNINMNNKLMSALRSELKSISVTIGDDKIDKMMDKMDEIENLKS